MRSSRPQLSVGHPAPATAAARRELEQLQEMIDAVCLVVGLDPAVADATSTAWGTTWTWPAVIGADVDGLLRATASAARRLNPGCWTVQVRQRTA